MGPYCKIRNLRTKYLTSRKKKILAVMEVANEEELKKLDKRLAEAEKIEGESEISDALEA